MSYIVPMNLKVDTIIVQNRIWSIVIKLNVQKMSPFFLLYDTYVPK